MGDLIGARTTARAQKIIALLKAGKDRQAQKLAPGFVNLFGPASPGAMRRRS